MEYYRENFEMICDTTYNSAVFLFKEPFAPGKIRPRLIATLSLADKISLMDRAASHFSGQHADWLRASKEHFIAMVGHADQRT